MTNRRSPRSRTPFKRLSGKSPLLHEKPGCRNGGCRGFGGYGRKRGLDEGRDHQRADLAPTARRPTALLRLCFPKQRPPKLDEVFRAIELALRPTGCLSCGFDGLDFLLRLDTIIGPDPKQFVATLEGEL